MRLPFPPRPVSTVLAQLTIAAGGFGAEATPGAGRADPVLPEVRVSATPERGLTSVTLEQLTRNAARVPGGTGVIDAAAFAEGRTGDFHDFLRRAVGVHLASDNAGEVTKISIRGSGIQSDEPLGVQVLLDGLPVNQGDGEANLEELDLMVIKGAEILRGANALRHGSYVLGGAINLVGYTGRDVPGMRLRLETGSAGYRRASVSAGGSAGRWDGLLALAGRRSDGFREHSAERTFVINANVGHRFSNYAENRIYLSWADWRRELPGDLTQERLYARDWAADPEFLAGDFRVHTRSLRLADRLVYATADARTEIGALAHRREFLLHDRFTDDYRQGVTDAESDNFALKLIHERSGTLLGQPINWLLGLAPAHETERSENFRNERGAADRTLRTAASVTRGINFPAFGEIQAEVAERVSVVAGVQLVWIERDFDDRYPGDRAGDQSARQIFRSVHPKLGVVLEPRENIQVFANVSRSFQPPSFDDLNPFAEGADGSVVHVPLRAQRAWTAEVGSRGAHGRFSWDAAWYFSWLRHELLELNDAAGREIGTTNAARTIHHGVELGFEITLVGPVDPDTPGHRLLLRQEYMLNDFRFDDDPVYRDRRIAGLPTHAYEAELSYHSPVGAYVAARLESVPTDYFADHANTLKARRFADLDLTVGFQREAFSLFFELRNVTDQTYAAVVKPVPSAKGIDDDDLAIFAPAAGRSVYLGVSFAW